MGREKKNEEREGEKEEIVVGEKREEKTKGHWEDLEVRLRSLELERERKRREKKKRNVIIRKLVVKKEEVEGLREEVKEIVRTTGAVARVEGIKKIGIRESVKII